ncbi:HNH endonuclease [Dolichospermum circinale]|uniref:HNH endonuclease n=1 Tax=Dolichospermum circinale TaxID=109265 RepID=UPI00042690E3|nr:HNH endonuclease [Dolichospermum circinale]MDB9476244.1 HNH endonuclease [Dolichospermum circinale CS-537/11]MDB9480334.1 HNH endonuclease [Dolichospermum circinale CS-537/03]MDB9483768.1 HNH endonuclease [Dolichospermum circinale CS-537/05]
MISVSRPSEPPKVLKRNGNKWLHKLQQALANLETLKNQPIINQKELAQAENEVEKTRNKYKNKDIKEALETIFHGKCAYCESKVTTTGYGDIEHFCPKSKSRCIDLTFEWTNLLLSCEKCNDAGHKGTKFPLDALEDEYEPVEGMLLARSVEC